MTNSSIVFQRIFTLLFLLTPLVSFAQKEANIWYFGNQAGLDFNQVPAKLLLDGALKSHEGSATMADENGKLLFYTNGEIVWNKGHQVMENGRELGGHQSARQAAVIVHKPASPGIYYIMTMDAREGAFKNGLRYSIVDITENNGLGKVIEKGVQLHTPGAESLSVAGSCMDGEEQQYWAVAANYNEKGKVYAYKIDKNGINKTPVVSSFRVKGEMISYIKFSPTGNKVVLIDQQLIDAPHTADKYTQLIIANFDFQTGSFSTPQYLKIASSRHFNQAEFSPDGKLLYASSGKKILQIDLNTPAFQVKASIETSIPILGDFQLAPDGNIYLPTATTLSMIKNPNEVGLEGKFIEGAIDLGGREANLGLPSFVTSYLYNGLAVDAGKDTAICSGQALSIGMQPQQGVSYQWYPTDHLSSSRVANPVFNFDNIGDDVREITYILTATNEHCSKKDTVKLQVYPAPPDKIRGSKSVCPAVVGVEYSVPQKKFYSYQWQVEGGTITAGQGTAAIHIDWGPTNPDAKVIVSSTSSKGCEASMIELPVSINVELDTETPQGPEAVCLNQRQQVQYAVTNTNGSVYTWSVSGGVITEGQGTHQVLIDWAGLGKHQLWLQEESITRDTICFGASSKLEVLVYKDTSQIALDYVSLSLQDEKLAQVQGNKALGAVASADFVLYRRQWGSDVWQHVGIATKENIAYIDGDLESDKVSYEYKIATLNPCEEDISSPSHRTILLQGEADTKRDQLFLDWNPYEGWTAGVARYEVWRRVDEQDSLQLIATTDANTNQLIADNGADGFTHYYRIKAVEKQSGYVSWSNEIILSFTHDLMIPNVFTPNGDEYNQAFEIKKLEMYPDNELTIYNRWGEVVFWKRGYRNEWDGTGAAAGVYYYSLRLNRTAQHYKGWVMILSRR